jgi:predicted CoA-substrate-specific enzyme activase
MPLFLGIDIGSRTAKAVLISGGAVTSSLVLETGGDYRRVTERLRAELLAKAGAAASEVVRTAATGRRGNVGFADQDIDDIRCCARGINHLFPTVRTVIDVQAQSSQVIRVSERGLVEDFVVSEKCAGGSGRFLDVIANVLRMKVEEIGPASLEAEHPVVFSTGCAVFGESEAISRVAEGTAREDILAGVHEAVALKVSALVSRVGLREDCAISGGGGLNVGLVAKIGEKLKVKPLVPPKPQLVNALGAAIIAAENAAQHRGIGPEVLKRKVNDVRHS